MMLPLLALATFYPSPRITRVRFDDAPATPPRNGATPLWDWQTRPAAPESADTASITCVLHLPVDQPH